MTSRNLLLVIIQFSVLLRSIYTQTEPTTGSCEVPLTRGLRDDQFSASSEYDVIHNASSARFGGVGWIAAEKEFQYLQVDLEDIWEITKISFQGSDIGWYTWKFRISYSNDGNVWMPYKTRLSEDNLGDIFERQYHSTTAELNPSLKARYVTLSPMTYYSRPSLLIELFGCHHAKAFAEHSTIVEESIEVDTTWIPSQSPILINSTIVVRPATTLKIQAGVSVIFTSESAGIQVDTTWIPSQSPILINSTIVVRPATTLKIQAGVSVIFTSESAGIQVWGILMSDGIAGLNVLLSSNYPTLIAHSRWLGVIQQTGGNITILNTIIRQAFAGVQGNGSHVRIAHCEIYSCMRGIRLNGGLYKNFTDIGALIDNDRLILQHVNVHDNIKGLELIGSLSYSNIYIGHSKFDSNIENGISIVNWDTGENNIPTHLIIFNSSVSKNDKGGIRCYGQPMTKFSIKQTIFYRNSHFGLLYENLFPSEFLVHINISDSNFSENIIGFKFRLYCPHSSCISRQRIEVNLRNITFLKNDQAVDLYYVVSDSISWTEADIKIVNNAFVSNSRDIEYLFKSTGVVHAYVENNSFEQSRFPLKAQGNKLNNSMSLMKNKFTICWSRYDTDELFNIIDIAAQIVNNTFEHCTMASGVYISHCSGSAFSFNSFINSSVSVCYISIGESYDDNNTFSIDNNYWGTSDITSIKAKTCDYFLDSSKAIANLNYYFTNEAMETKSETYYIDAFRFIDDVPNNVTYIGGIIDSNVDLSELNGHRLVLNRSIIVLEGVDVKIANASIVIKRNRGIKVYGSLTIGKQNDVTSNTELLLEGTMSRDNKWNGINMSSAAVYLYSVTMYGMDSLLEVKGSDSIIFIHNFSSTTMSMKHLIDADISNGNLSLLVEDSNISTTSTSIQVTPTNSYLGIIIKGCSFKSRDEIISARVSTTDDYLALTNLHISRSSLISINFLDWGIFFEGCSSHVKAVIEASNLSATNEYYGISLFHFLSMDINIIDNTFDNAAKTSLKFSFCKNKSTNFTKEINVRGNSFYASRNDGIDVELYDAYTYGHGHIISIANNTFDGRSTQSRKGIECYGYRTPHIFTLESNLFKNYGDVVVKIRCRLQNMVIKKQ